MQQSSRRRHPPDESQPASENAPMSLPQHDSPRQDADLIAQRAYQRYEARGREDGHDMEDWLSAEQELGAGSPSEGNTRRDGGDAA